jgi:hypothetical protein
MVNFLACATSHGRCLVDEPAFGSVRGFSITCVAAVSPAVAATTVSDVAASAGFLTSDTRQGGSVAGGEAVWPWPTVASAAPRASAT